MLIVYFFIQFPAMAQNSAGGEFIDYDKLKSGLILKVQELQRKGGLEPLTSLKAQAQAIGPESKAGLKRLKAGTVKLSGRELIEKRKSSILMLCKYYRPEKVSTDQVKVVATAIALSDDGTCLTNWHVLMDLLEPSLQVNSYDSLVFVANLKGEIFPIEKVLSFSKDADEAVFKVKAAKGTLEPIPLGLGSSPGDPVHTITNPDGYPYYYSYGVVARNTAQMEKGILGNRMEITADYAKGSSGGAILDEFGNLTGMVSSTHSIYYQDRPESKLQMVIKTTIPVQSIQELLKFQ